mgnify:CR=1 FL=1
MNSVCAMILTIVSGVIVFFVCEILREIWFVPLHEYLVVKGKIARALTFYNTYFENPCNQIYLEGKPKEEHETANTELRQLASELKGLSETIIFYIRIPPKEKLNEIADELLKLAELIYKTENKEDCSEQIEETKKKVFFVKKELGLFKVES